MDALTSVRLAEVSRCYAEGTHILLYGVDGIPDNTKGVVDFVDDTGQVFVETEGKLKNVVLSPGDEGVHFFKDCVSYANVVSDKICALEDIEIADVIGNFEPWDATRDYAPNGVEAFAWLTDSFIASVPEYKECLSEDNDFFVNGYVSWCFDTDVVKLHTFLNDDNMKSEPKEFFLSGKDREFVVNAFNKFFIENEGYPAKLCFDYKQYEEKVLSFLDNHKMSAKVVLENPMFIERASLVCDINDLDKTSKVLKFIANKPKVQEKLNDVLANAKERSERTGPVKMDKGKEALGYGE